MIETKKLNIKRAEEKDFEAVDTIIMKTAEWLAERGSKQWSDIRSGEDEQKIHEAIKLGEVYLAYLEDGTTAGIFTLRDVPNEWDRACWGVDNSRENYYLHRLTVNRDLSGHQIGSQLLSGAAIVAESHGKKAIRLDCDANNAKLNEFYQANGFNFVKAVNIPHLGDDIDDFNLYQKNI